MSLPVVIIPVFNAYEQLQACLQSLDAHSCPAEVVLVNDASTDPRVYPLIESWVKKSSKRSLLQNQQNRGFIYSVNRGMSQATGDVVLLNSDTLVTPGWLEALSMCLAADEQIATATPWTNNGEIVSFPDFCKAAPVPNNYLEISEIIRKTGPADYPELPTAVGFCMAISRRALDSLGLFDEATFGRGYGEENDFCMRVTLAGMKNVLCDNAYVAHQGGASFSPLGLKPDSKSMQKLLAKHPEYQELVEEFISDDPLSVRRNTLIEAVQRQQVSIR